MVENQDIQMLSPHLVLADGSLVPFEKQVEAYAYGEMPTGDMFVICDNASDAGVPEAGALPILMRQKTMRKVQADHEISLSEIEKLPHWLETHPLALESITEENGLVVVADASDRHGNDIVIAMHLEKEHRQIILNEIASVYGKRNLAYLVENTDALDKQVFLNERTGDWIRRTGLPLPERIANRLQVEYTSPATSEQRAFDLLMEGSDFYNPENGTFLDSRLNEAIEPELVAYEAPLHEIKKAIASLRSDGMNYGDGSIAPFELVSGEAPVAVDFPATRLSLSDDFFAIRGFATSIACGRWVEAGSNLDSLVERSDRMLDQSPVRQERPASLRDQGSKCDLAARQMSRGQSAPSSLSHEPDTRQGGERE